MNRNQKLSNSNTSWHKGMAIVSGTLLLWLNNLVLLADASWGKMLNSQDESYVTNVEGKIAQRNIPTFTNKNQASEPTAEFTSPLSTEESTQDLIVPPPAGTAQTFPQGGFVPPPTLPNSQPNNYPQPTGYDPPDFELFPSNQFSPYRLGINDVVSVTVQRFPEFNAQSVISGEGNIVIPILGRISLQGLTLEEAETKISFELNNRFLQSPPEVTVQTVGLRPSQVTIVGEVSRPGFYQLAPGANLATALLSAGGSTTYADLRSVIVRRSLFDGTVIEQKINLLKPLQNGTSVPDLRLQDGDAVIVSKIEIGDDQDYDGILASRSTLAQQQIRIRILSYAGAGLGTLPLANGSTFLDALTAISPSLDNAKLSDISLVRFDPEQGQAMSQSIDGKALLRGDLAQNVPLNDNDVIIIGRNLIAKITFALGRFTQPFRDVLGFLLFFDQLAESATDLFEFNE